MINVDTNVVSELIGRPHRYPSPTGSIGRMQPSLSFSLSPQHHMVDLTRQHGSRRLMLVGPQVFIS